MMKFAANPAFREYERRLIAIHRLIREGNGDSTEADTIRDEMERYSNDLTREEELRLNELSADLYMLANDEIPAAGWEKYSPEKLRSDLQNSYE